MIDGNWFSIYLAARYGSGGWQRSLAYLAVIAVFLFILILAIRADF